MDNLRNVLSQQNIEFCVHVPAVRGVDLKSTYPQNKLKFSKETKEAVVMNLTQMDNQIVDCWNAVGCYRSHEKIWKWISKNGQAFVCENDLTITGENLPYFNKCMKELAALTNISSIDYILMSYITHHDKPIRLPDSENWSRLGEKTYGSSCYFLSQNRARELLKNSSVIHYSLDCFMTHFIGQQVKLFYSKLSFL